MAADENRDDRVLSPETVMQKVDLSRTTIWRLSKRGDFPQPIRLSPGRVGYSSKAVDAWLAGRMGQAA